MSVVETERTGKISDFYDSDSGLIIEDQTNQPYEFVQHGAQVNFNKGDNVWFITIVTPSGNVIVKRVGKPA